MSREAQFEKDIKPLLEQLMILRPGSEEWEQTREILKNKDLGPEEIDKALAAMRGEKGEQHREDNEFLLKQLASGLKPEETLAVEEILRSRGLGKEVDLIKKDKLPPEFYRE